MASLDSTERIYESLADHYDRGEDGPLRDRFLVLAADAALAAGREPEAERLRARLLRLNASHLLHPYASMREALESPDVRNYLAGLRRSYPADRARALLAEADPQGKSTRAAQPPTGEAIPTAAGVLKVYNLRDDSKGATPALKAPSATPPAARAATPDKARPVQANYLPFANRFSTPDDEDTDASTPAVLVAGSLFWLVLAGGAVVFLYVLARPFLP